MIPSQTAAIVWAQWRSLRNMLPRSGLGFYITAALTVMWYGMWLIGAVAVALVLSQVRQSADVLKILGPGLLVAFLYWQVIPVLMVSSGASLNMRRLQVYPIPYGQLFTLEVLLRVTTGLEMMAMLAGTAVGLWSNPIIPVWAPLSLAPFVLLNLFLAAGVRSVLGRLFAGRRFREAAMAILFLIAALPQIMLRFDAPREKAKAALLAASAWPFPWTLTARVSSGEAAAGPWIGMFAWTFAFYAFGRWQFERGLRFDEEAAGATRSGPASGERKPLLDRLFRLPAALFADPVAAMIEKELRSLARSSRFRVLFVMGFTFGLAIWLPMMFGREPSRVISGNYLTFLSLYALMLLSEVLIWNFFGYDRAAAQVYYVTPVPPVSVLRAKNAAAACFVILEMFILTLVCVLLRLPVSAGKIVEAYAVTLIFLGYITAVGNFSSIYYPRMANPRKGWGSSATGRLQALLMLIYPVVAIPVGLAYAARYFLSSEIAFVALLALAGAGSVAAYRASLRRMSTAAYERREQIIAALSQGESPVST